MINNIFFEFKRVEEMLINWPEAVPETLICKENQELRKNVFAKHYLHKNSVLYCDDLETFKKHQNKKFDQIFLHDILDHVENPISLLREAKKISKEIIVRFHPFCSKHGGHLHKKLNKAYAHLIFTKNELKILGTEIHYGQKVLYPLKTYRMWIKESGLKIADEIIYDSIVDSFFTENKIIEQRLKSKFEGDEFPFFQLSKEYIDYVLL